MEAWQVREKVAEDHGRYAWLFGLILIFQVAIPLVEGFPGVEFIAGLSFLVVLGRAGWLTLVGRGRWVFTALMLTSVASTALRITPASPAVSWWLLYHAAFFALIAVLVSRFAVTRPRVTTDTIFAALSGFYLIGVAWALLFIGVDHIQPGSFSVPLVTDNGLSTGLYFSLVTLTTLGYGDIAPVLPLARALTTTEALMGQTYLVVLVARLVSLHSGESVSAPTSGMEPPKES
jgi:hypothetical protein